MRHTLGLLALSLCLALGAAGELPLRQRWPEGLRQALESGQARELLSLDPGDLRPLGAPSGQAFHRWAVLGRASLESEEATSLGRALVAGIEAKTDHRVSECFAPRHGLRAGEFDLVICFECAKIQVYENGQSRGQMLMTEQARDSFNAAVQRHVLAWAGWVEKEGWWRAAGLSIPPLSGFGHAMFGRRLAFQRELPRLHSQPVKPVGEAVLVHDGQEADRFPVGHQEMAGLAYLAQQLKTYAPLGLDIQLDEASRTLTCRGTTEDLDKARGMLEAMSRLPAPRTEIALTCQVPEERAAAQAARYRQEWEREYEITLKPVAAPPTDIPVRELFEGRGRLDGAETRFVIGVLGPAKQPVVLQFRQPVHDPEPDLLERFLRSLSR